MSGKSIIVIGALAAGAYLLLGGSGAFGGAEGGGSKKATAITGVVPGFDGGGSPPGGGGSPSYPETPSAPSAPFQPSQYLLDLISQKYNPSPVANSLGIIPESFSMSGNKYQGVRNVGESSYQVEGDFMPSKKMELNVETGQLFTRDTGGIGNEVLYTEKSKKIASPPSNVARVVNSSGSGYSYGGFGSSWGSPGNTTKKSSSSSSSAYSRSVANSSTSGWSSSLHSRMGVA